MSTTVVDGNVVSSAVTSARRAKGLYDEQRESLALSELARSFPALVAKPGTAPFSAAELYRWARHPSRTQNERDCAAFVLHVADRKAPWTVWFDVMEVMQRWNAVERAVFVEWAHQPWWATS